MIEAPGHAAVLTQGRWLTSYRNNACPTPREQLAQEALARAADAIHLAILTISHQVGQEQRRKAARRIVRVQEHLVDACHALRRAKVHVPGIWAYSNAVILDQDPDPAREIARLNKLTSNLAVRNHAVLPALPQSTPLSPEDEAQLAEASQDLCTINRARKYQVAMCMIATLLCVGIMPLAGVLSLGAALLFAALGMLRAKGTAKPLDRPLLSLR